MAAPRRNFIAIDGSQNSQKAFDWYLENLHRDGDLVLIGHCAEYNINMGIPGHQDIKTINEMCEAAKKKDDEIHNITEGYLNTLRAKHIQSKVLILAGKPGEALCKSASEEGADHIVIGTRGLGTLRRTLLGSVSEYVLHHSSCPVTIVKSPEQNS